MTYAVYVVHRSGFTVELPSTNDPNFALNHAHQAANEEIDCLVRVFRDGTFETAYSVLNGYIAEHKDVTIPWEFW